MHSFRGSQVPIGLFPFFIANVSMSLTCAESFETYDVSVMDFKFIFTLYSAPKMAVLAIMTATSPSVTALGLPFLARFQRVS